MLLSRLHSDVLAFRWVEGENGGNVLLVTKLIVRSSSSTAQAGHSWLDLPSESAEKFVGNPALNLTFSIKRPNQFLCLGD